MNRAKKTDISRQIGLEIGCICGEYFLKLNHLHYGYWTDPTSLDVANLHSAQDQYTNFVLSHIPPGVGTILDVGCGTGQIAKRLIKTGYQVDCVSPDPFLSKSAGQLLQGKSRIFQCRYEDLQTENRYDIALFCESFQYINMAQAISKSREILNDGGHLLICDIFRKPIEDKSSMGGGHNLDKFYELMTQASFQKIKDLDITEQTAPNMDLLNDVMQKVVQPVTDAGLRFLHSRHPLTLKILGFRYKKKFERLNRKYFSGYRTAETFKKYKSYRLLLYKKATPKTS